MIDTAGLNFPIDKQPDEMNLEERLAYYEYLAGEFKRKEQERDKLQLEIARMIGCSDPRDASSWPDAVQMQDCLNDPGSGIPRGRL